MDDLQEHLARLALALISDHGFVLGGGHAVQLHGMGSRPSEDIDLFTNRRGQPGEVHSALEDEFRRHGYTVNVTRQTPDLVQMIVTDQNGRACKVDLGVFWQAHTPVHLEVGPVLHPDDAVAGKMDALYNRWAPRDFLDIDAILTSGRYTTKQLEAVAHEHNPGFDRGMFAESLSYLTSIPDREFTAYGRTPEQIAAMRTRLAQWQRSLLPPG